VARRERLRCIRCANTGCGETTTYAYTSGREYDEIQADQRRKPWKCSRHREPSKVLRVDNTTTTATVTSARGKYDIAYWATEGATTGSGIESGPGFIAHAADFPEGTRLVVTARIELPDREVNRHECCPPTCHHEGATP